MSTREELTLQAERCLRQGRADDAIALYRDLVQLEPVEWGLVRQLADLLERAGQREGAARQFSRWADHVCAEGFHAKAAALYKKVLKLDEADEHALWQLGEVSVALKLRADARVAFQRVADLRLRRGDVAGAAIAVERRDAVEAVAAAPSMPPTVPPAYMPPRTPLDVVRVTDVPSPPLVVPPANASAPAAPRAPGHATREAGPIVDDAPVVDRVVPVLSDADAGPARATALAAMPGEIALNADDPRLGRIGAALPVALEPSGGAPAIVAPVRGDAATEGSAFDWAHLLGRDVEAPASTLIGRESNVSTPDGGDLAAGLDDVGGIDEEMDLTRLLEELKQWDPELPEPLRKPSNESPGDQSARTSPPQETSGLDEVLDAAFADLQREGDARTVAAQQLAAGRVFLAAGLASEAARAFERASAEPRARFDAATALAELHRSRGQLREAARWFEVAAAAPVPDAAVTRAVLYDLAESLEAIGQTDRALGVLLDLLSQVEDYRDARVRLDRLLRAEAGG
jgi:tetratricopeptide (TPR) repeat protein